MTALDNNFWHDFNVKWNNSYNSEELSKKFDETKNLDDFLAEMEAIKKDIDPRFLESFKKYETEVSSLLSDNLSVVASREVQWELATQNARIKMAFEKDSIKLSNEYTRIFW